MLRLAEVHLRECCPGLSPGERSSWDNGYYFWAADGRQGRSKTQGRVSDPGAPPTLFTDALSPPPLSRAYASCWLVNRAVMEGVCGILLARVFALIVAAGLLQPRAVL